jgi:hypothetical protein
MQHKQTNKTKKQTNKKTNKQTNKQTETRTSRLQQAVNPLQACDNVVKAVDEETSHNRMHESALWNVQRGHGSGQA